MDIESVAGYVANEKQKTNQVTGAQSSAGSIARLDLGCQLRISGKKDFAISRNLQTERDMPRFVKITNRPMDIESVSGLVFSEQQKITCHRSVKHGWKHYQVGVGLFFQTGGRRISPSQGIRRPRGHASSSGLQNGRWISSR